MPSWVQCKFFPPPSLNVAPAWYKYSSKEREKKRKKIKLTTQRKEKKKDKYNLYSSPLSSSAGGWLARWIQSSGKRPGRGG